MRVIGGKAKGRQLATVRGDNTRPILDRVRTALFDLLRPALDGLAFLDLFAGTGSVGIEALSQGAAHCTFIDLNHKACEVIRRNLETTELAAQAEVLQTDAFAFLRRNQRPFGLVYVAPPQYQNLWLEALHTLAEFPDNVTPGGQVVTQLDPREYEPVELAEFKEERQKQYGNTLLVFYRRAQAQASL